MHLPHPDPLPLGRPSGLLVRFGGVKAEVQCPLKSHIRTAIQDAHPGVLRSQEAKAQLARLIIKDPRCQKRLSGTCRQQLPSLQLTFVRQDDGQPCVSGFTLPSTAKPGRWRQWCLGDGRWLQLGARRASVALFIAGHEKAQSDQDEQEAAQHNHRPHLGHLHPVRKADTSTWDARRTSDADGSFGALPRRSHQSYHMPMKRWIVVLGACGVAAASTSPSAAQEPESNQQTTADSTAGTEATSGETASAESPDRPESNKPLPMRLEEIPKDPEGIRGLSPYWEAIARGDATTLALDFRTSSDHYRRAIALLPKRPEAHLRMAEISLKQGQMMQAQDFIAAALRFSTDDVRAKIHATLLLAFLRERQHAHEDAIDSYRKYAALDGALPAAPKPQSEPNAQSGPKPPHVFTETARKRIAAIERRLELERQYSVVAERIKRNVEAADHATGADAGK